MKNFKFRFKDEVIELLDEERNSTNMSALARKIGVNYSTLRNIFSGGSSGVKNTVKFIKYFQKYHSWKKDDWKDKLFEV